MSDSAEQVWLDRKQVAQALGVAERSVYRKARDPGNPLGAGVKRGRKSWWPWAMVEKQRRRQFEAEGKAEDYKPMTPDSLRELGVRVMGSTRGRPEAVGAIQAKLAMVLSPRAARAVAPARTALKPLEAEELRAALGRAPWLGPGDPGWELKTALAQAAKLAMQGRAQADPLLDQAVEALAEHFAVSLTRLERQRQEEQRQQEERRNAG